jgi:hypothetical protein
MTAPSYHGPVTVGECPECGAVREVAARAFFPHEPTAGYCGRCQTCVQWDRDKWDGSPVTVRE